MEKLNLRPIKPARLVKQLNGVWYLLWYSNSKRYRLKAGLNYIKNLELRQSWADNILNFINTKIQNGEIVRDIDIPNSIQPPPFVENPVIKEPEIVCKKAITFFEHWRSYTHMKAVEGKRVNKLNSLLSVMRQFAATEGVDDYEFAAIDRDWATRFKSFCIARENGINHLSGNFKVIRRVLKDADIEADIQVNPKYKSQAFRINEVKTDEIALNLAEIERIYRLDLSAFPEGCTTVRDNFVVGCLTALRFGDWDITAENLDYLRDGDKSRPILRVITKKTGEIVIIPLHPMALATLQKYGFNMPTISNQNSNEYLKIIAKLAGLNETVLLRRSKSNKMITVKKMQYEEVKTHTARRTFVTVALFELNLPPAIVMKITGHKSEKQLFEYGRISKEKAAMIMAKAMETYLKGI